jgi:holo-[acyl-carrier protein] synthase
MQTLQTGIDLVEIARLTELKDTIRQKFIERVFTQHEINSAGGSNEILAEYFAAKEAAVKALGCGIGSVGWRDIEIRLDDDRPPILQLYNEASRMAQQQGLSAWSVSFSHTELYALALVIGYNRST